MTGRRSLRLSAAALTAGLLSLGTALGSGGESRAASSAGGSPPSADTTERFPHREHAGLFPLCTGCHRGIGSGDSAAFYPDAESCATCHDGEQAERVAWSGPRRQPSGLSFDHAGHAAEMRREEDGEASCESCHTSSGGERMAVRGRAVPDRCLSCHEHEAREHYVDAACATCHRPLAETGFALRRIAALPEPAGHDADDFLIEAHGETAEEGIASCQTCHTRERCTSCHVDGASREAVATLPSAPAAMELPSMAARYPTPASHESRAWLEEHGERATTAECATCHTRQSCSTCHREAPPGAVGRLPDRRRIGAPGVEPNRRVPDSHRAPGFVTEHGDLAAADPGSCTSCHSESSCTDCHAGGAASTAPAAPVGTGRNGEPEGGVEADTIDSDSADAIWPGTPVRSEPGGFHPENFMARHASAAYGNRMECSSCHSTGAFCRDCHQQTGMGSSGRIGPGFHDAQPLWLLRHGQAARQALESCASCHRQTDCIQCHSTTGAFSVNPHGPDFDAERFAERNRQVCFACHLSDPLGRGSE